MRSHNMAPFWVEIPIWFESSSSTFRKTRVRKKNPWIMCTYVYHRISNYRYYLHSLWIRYPYRHDMTLGTILRGHNHRFAWDLADLAQHKSVKIERYWNEPQNWLQKHTDTQYIHNIYRLEKFLQYNTMCIISSIPYTMYNKTSMSVIIISRSEEDDAV